MERNLGIADRIIRVVIAVIIAVLYITGVVTGLLGTILLVLAVIFVLTSFLGICPAYGLFGLRSHSINRRRPSS